MIGLCTFLTVVACGHDDSAKQTPMPVDQTQLQNYNGILFLANKQHDVLYSGALDLLYDRRQQM